MECLHVGEPLSNFYCWESKTIYIHNFLDLPDTKSDDNYVKSPDFKCFGHTWRLVMYPGGDDTAKGGYVSICIENWTSRGITLDFKLTLPDVDGKECHQITGGMEQFDADKGCVFDLVKRATLVRNQILCQQSIED